MCFFSCEKNCFSLFHVYSVINEKNVYSCHFFHCYMKNNHSVLQNKFSCFLPVIHMKKLCFSLHNVLVQPPVVKMTQLHKETLEPSFPLEKTCEKKCFCHEIFFSHEKSFDS